MVSKGDKITFDFQLNVVQDGIEKEVRFDDLLTQPTVVTVYMKNNTRSCDLQNVSLVPVAEELAKKGIQIVSLSKDGCKSHINYAAKHGIPYILASDPDHYFAQATDSMVEKKMYGKVFHGPSRSAFFIDTDGTVLGVIEKVTPASHGEEILALVS
ncbi:MAG TPA: peroxiredoxin [Bacteroidetes bacterium]|nr:peroxiredoxin [Bacteroidota bacterium]HBW00213.1 peroxiredoxin [Bacteroidota bacterium]|tara:strand:+ start:59 stop:526 length:468 start_codon:yes stop_codon:yes gene_type:complete